MALEECRECGHQVAERAIMCPSCGAPVPDVAGGYSAATKIPSALTIAGGVFMGTFATAVTLWLLYVGFVTGAGF